MNTIRILLADDHILIRAGVRSLLENIEGMEVVTEASDGREALELVKQHAPNIVLTDISMPGLNGLEAIIPPVEFHPICMKFNWRENEPST